MDILFSKIDIYMHKHILPKFDPEKIHWVFSISGGKDSFIMCYGIKNWYQEKGYKLSASGLHIWQWGENNIQLDLQKQFPWLDEIYVADARFCTETMIKQKTDKQAPCRSCSDIRRHVSDKILGMMNRECPIILCRGLHLTDMTISILWRLAWYGPGNKLENKGMPLVHLFDQVYLSKPLCYFREYECQAIAQEFQYQSVACDCPATKYPSRRDIIEESLRYFYRSSLWEFDVPGTKEYLRDTLGIEDDELLKGISLPGQEKKSNLIPDDFYKFACDFYASAMNQIRARKMDGFLESHISDFLEKGIYATNCDGTMGCKLLSKQNELTDFDMRMIATLGPFWGAIALRPELRNYYFQLQKNICGIELDVRWKQVYYLLKLYYNEN